MTAQVTATLIYIPNAVFWRLTKRESLSTRKRKEKKINLFLLSLPSKKKKKKKNVRAGGLNPVFPRYALGAGSAPRHQTLHSSTVFFFFLLYLLIFICCFPSLEEKTNSSFSLIEPVVLNDGRPCSSDLHTRTGETGPPFQAHWANAATFTGRLTRTRRARAPPSFFFFFFLSCRKCRRQPCTCFHVGQGMLLLASPQKKY